MSSTNKYQKTYSGADIEKYLKGELSAREMHDLEAAALEDPFLADALDGMSVQLSPAPAADLTTRLAGLRQDLNDLRTRLDAKTATAPTGHSRRIPVVLRWAVAACLILLLGIGLTWHYNPFGNAPSLAKQPVIPSPAAASDSASALSLASSPASKPASPAASAPIAKTAPPPAKPENSYTAKLTTRHATPPPSAETPAPAKLMAETKPPADKLSKSDIADKEVEDSARIPQLMPLASTRQQQDSLTVSGIVLDNHNNPLPGASLVLKGYSDAGTVTDLRGQFSLRVLSQDSAQNLTVTRAGYGLKSLSLTTLDINEMHNNVIRLQPDHPSLDEVEVVGYGSKRKETMATAPSASDEPLDSLWQKASPAVGGKAYLQYLVAAQKTLVLDSTITGTEAVSFEVDRKGTLTSFKIEQSLSPAHDDAIIRLVKEGPAWHLLNRKKTRAVVSLHF